MHMMIDYLKALTYQKVIAHPTETVYGLMADAASKDAIDHLYKLKERDNKPSQIMVDTVENAKEIAVFSSEAERIAEQFFPGPLTLILPVKKEANLDARLIGEGGTVGIRIPDYPELAELLQKYGKPVAASSANRAGKSPLLTAEAIAEEFGDGLAAIAPVTRPFSEQPSTVVRLEGDRFTILREGAITPAMLEDALR